MRIGTCVCILAMFCAGGCASQGSGVSVKMDGAGALPEQQDVFVTGTEGYHTFRIPALAVTRKGTVLAFCEGRKSGRGDSGAIDTVLKRSTDNGKSWGPLQVVAPGGEDTCGNPCPIVDEKSGTILLLLTKNKGSVSEGEINLGQAPPRTVWITRSADDGVTWSPVEDISGQARKPEWRWYATGPGHGIQLENGRLVAPCDHSLGPDSATWHSHVICSDDGGDSWKIGGVAERETNECIVVQLSDGSLCLNMRNYRGTHRRAVATSSDMGLTWSPVRDDPALVEPVCQASILRIPSLKKGSPDLVVFSNPANEKRVNMSVRVSNDQCATWSAPKTLWAGPAAYSDLAVAADKRIACLYERGTDSAYETITMALFTRAWLSDNK